MKLQSLPLVPEKKSPKFSIPFIFHTFHLCDLLLYWKQNDYIAEHELQLNLEFLLNTTNVDWSQDR